VHCGSAPNGPNHQEQEAWQILIGDNCLMAFQFCFFRNDFMIEGGQFVFVVQDGLCKWNGIPAANKDVPLEVHISGWEDHQNGKKCRVETLKKLSLSRDLCKKPSLKKLPFSYLKPLFPFKLDLK